MNTETQNYETEKKILDSGNRRQFNSGAVRDIQEGKGRLDLLPLGEVSDFFMLLKDTHEKTLESCKWANYSAVTFFINLFMQTQDRSWILKAIRQFAQSIWDEPFTPILELAKHYEEGAKKYSDRNWEKGIPCHCYVDSGLRHLTKFYRGDQDEPHDRAFLWNMFGLLWTLRNRPECNDLPYEGTKLTEPEESYIRKDIRITKEVHSRLINNEYDNPMQAVDDVNELVGALEEGSDENGE